MLPPYVCVAIMRLGKLLRKITRPVTWAEIGLFIRPSVFDVWIHFFYITALHLMSRQNQYAKLAFWHDTDIWDFNQNNVF